MFTSNTTKTIYISLIAIFLLCMSWGFFIEPNMLVVNRQSISIPNLPEEYKNMKVLVIGDVHTGSPFIDEKKLEKIVKISNKEKPDLFLLLGDYVIEGVVGGKFVDPSITTKYLSRVKAPRGHIAILGNHDWWYNGYKTKQALEKSGIRVLENESVNIARNNEKPLWIAGLADNIERIPDIYKSIKNVNSKDTVILLTHEPDFFGDFANNIPYQVKLVLSGHVHGGQVRLPFIGAIITPSSYGNRYSKEFIVENGKQMFVTSGIGTSILPVRFLCPPEIVVITLN
jgi:uncharacterized protein